MHGFVLIVGPTASGKSELSLNLSERFGGAVLNCDSLQAYQRVDIGTAKPTPLERARVPHHLLDVVEPGAVLTAGDFRQLALSVLKSELPHRPVFGVGGSGFYIQALLKGMFDVPKPKPEIEERVRQRCQTLGLPAMYQELTRRDPEYSHKIKPQDAYRIVRALVLMEESGQTVTEVRQAFKPQPFPYPLLQLGIALDRETLLKRVEERTRRMLKAGLLNEVRELVREGYRDWPPLSSVGYKECVQVLEGQMREADLPQRITEKTMQLAKRQRTWFKRDPDIHWVETLAQAEALVGPFLDR